MDNIKFRSAKISDLPTLFDFEQGIVSAERPFDPTLEDGHINYYDIKALIESDDAEVIVAVSENTPVASGYIKIKKAKPYLKFDQFGYIGFMFVEPAHRGKGISRGVLEKLKSWAKARDIDELRLEVYADNNSARSAYEKFGFEKHFIEMRINTNSV